MKYSHRKAQMEANRLKNLANPNFQKRQVKYDREKKKREEKRNLRMQAIINGVEIDMSYMKSMSNRQRKKEEQRIREAKQKRQERLAEMGLAPAVGSKESSPASSDDEGVNGVDGAQINGNAQSAEGDESNTNEKTDAGNQNKNQSDEQAKSGQKRKTPANLPKEDEKKGAKKQKNAKTDKTATNSEETLTKDDVRKQAKSNKVAEAVKATKDIDTALSVEESGEDEDYTDGKVDDATEETEETMDVSRLNDSDSSESSDTDDNDETAAPGIQREVTQADLEIEGQEAAAGAEEEEDIPLSDLDSLASEEKGDIIPHQRLTINNHAALNKAYKSIALPYSQLQFSDHMSTTTAEAVQIPDVDDDLNRELAFYKQSLDAVNEARPKLKKEGIPFSRPTDYFAEMVKSDEHMGKIKQKLVDEAASRKAAAEARKQRDLKKFGKQVQIAKQQERAKEKRETMDKINVLKRKRQSAGTDAADESELFDVALEDAAETDRKERDARRAAGAGKPNAKRQKKNEKYGFGGKKRHAKHNDADSTNDVSGFSAKKMKGKKDKKLRPGKSKRANAKV
ncbi:MAG: rRNA-processing protein and EBNA1-binding protein ebp2 [Bathelium mastoideum]|nr:MAG: rRNA-processing protein and EBNA1-binding protein ebp2 [Bathelium mastoideum]